MSNSFIPDSKAMLAFDWLKDNAGTAAAARAERERAEWNLKQVKARLQRTSNEATVQAREDSALIHPDFQEAVDRLCEAIRADEEFRNNRNRAEALLDAWRTASANERIFSKVV